MQSADGRRLHENLRTTVVRVITHHTPHTTDYMQPCLSWSCVTWLSYSVAYRQRRVKLLYIG